MMEHQRFKSEQTAAAYVAGGLDPAVQEQFELHLLSCPDCVEEVQGWRALKGSLPLEPKPPRESTVPTSMVAHHGVVRRNYEKYGGRAMSFPTARWLNFLGLLLGLVGVIMLFYYGMPFHVPTNGHDYILSSNTNQADILLEQRYTLLGYVGLGLLVAGSVLQIIVLFAPVNKHAKWPE